MDAVVFLDLGLWLAKMLQDGVMLFPCPLFISSLPRPFLSFVSQLMIKTARVEEADLSTEGQTCLKYPTQRRFKG